MPIWFFAILGLAAVKTLIGFSGLAADFDPTGPGWQRDAFQIGHVVLFSAAAILLLVASRRDRRAVSLGGVFLLAAASPASAGLSHPWVSAPGWLAGLPALLGYLDPDAFLPLLCWMFFRDFPRSRTPGMRQPGARLAIGVSAAIGLALFMVTALSPLGPDSWHRVVLGPWFPLIFWAVVAAMALPALGYALWRVRAADTNERRRLRLFLSGFVVGAAPLFLAFLLAVVWPGFRRLLMDPHDRWGVSLGLMLLPMVIPVVTAYAVLVQDALDLRLVVRKAIRYAFARYTVLAATAIPFIVGGVLLYRHRERPLTEILSGGQLAALLSVAVIGLLLLVSRRTILQGIDRHFFREHYDASKILYEVADKSRSAGTPSELASLLQTQAGRALHVERSAVFILDRRGDRFHCTDRSARDLPASSLVTRMLAGSTDSMDVDLENQHSPLRRLPKQERQWLADGAYSLLTPLVDPAGSLVGIWALAEKRSELPFSGEDRALLGNAAASAAAALDRMFAEPPGAAAEVSRQWLKAPSGTAEDPAGQCLDCGAVYPAAGARCSACGRELEPAMLPQLVLGKYSLKRRLGAGGMGVVYLARDVELARNVAIKTLPRLSPELSLRLRREARAMASISHPNAALIYAVESRHGLPLLILEYLSGGTVRDRLAKSPFQPAEVVDLGIALSDALETAHASGLLHRDIKPSNVGYSRQGKPKLLDFGLARILADLHASERRPGPITASTLTFSLESEASTGRATAGLVGTPSYLAPEALLGRLPGPSFDLWSLAMLLLVTLTGHNPLQAGSVGETLRRVSQAELPPVLDLRPDCPPSLAKLLDECLEKDPSRRPRSARALRQRLESVQATLAAPVLAR